MQIDLPKGLGCAIHTRCNLLSPKGNENGIESFQCLTTIKYMQHIVRCITWNRRHMHFVDSYSYIGNGKNRKEVERKFLKYTYIQSEREIHQQAGANLHMLYICCVWRSLKLYLWFRCNMHAILVRISLHYALLFWDRERERPEEGIITVRIFLLFI